ncbi:hypothetical protein [Paracraurococcus ruber]|uniref:Uncharacterized protein n=1 Tax=Paracraurococcus ruber TaxID=77675 RepID=A0ABS1CWI6_9PROT|nr:hypothetical protein [Paracraurococcus ruber]MBK1658084.1 hypothetical protein [Paracraurococcus ruber]TDG32337.1 hypothetical protein E2C05_07400 [Paracraurococcus ruber]
MAGTTDKGPREGPGKGTGEPGWTEQEKSNGAPDRQKTPEAGNAGEAVPKGGYGGEDRAQTEAAAMQTEKDSGKPDR